MCISCKKLGIYCPECDYLLGCIYCLVANKKTCDCDNYILKLVEYLKKSSYRKIAIKNKDYCFSKEKDCLTKIDDLNKNLTRFFKEEIQYIKTIINPDYKLLEYDDEFSSRKISQEEYFEKIINLIRFHENNSDYLYLLKILINCFKDNTCFKLKVFKTIEEINKIAKKQQLILINKDLKLYKFKYFIL